jgi:hypothetical protein
VGKNAEFLYVKADGAQINQHVLKEFKAVITGTVTRGET